VGTVLVIDNYDSFTWNLVQEMGELGADLEVVRNDATTVSDVAALSPSGIVLSPGPGRPEDAGISCDLIRELGPSIPILGVCLGHQAIGTVYGATIGRAPTIMHGKTSEITHDGRGVFAGIASPLVATRYHSLVMEPDTIPDELIVTAHTSDGVVMGVRHAVHPVEGVQFHPESVLTSEGPRLLANFLSRLSVERGGDAREARAARSSSLPAGSSPR
jgi:anthranilate synthase/aminodeoxychorismate synthase-like glutamine amidotransferase